MPVNNDLTDDVRAEIERLHAFFEQWFDGSLPATDEAFSAVEDALLDRFLLVSPRADTDERGPLLESLRAAHGRRGVRIWIENVEVRHATEELVLATYEEWQQEAGDAAPRGRLSTALFRRDADCLRWLHVHETWLE